MLTVHSTPPTLAGLFFCLASDTVQGFYFARMQYSPIQAFTVCFAVSMQFNRPRHKTAHRTLQRYFLRLHPLNLPLYQTDTIGHFTACATLEGIHAPGYAQQIPDTTATPGRCTGQHRPPIIIRYIRGRGVPVMDPCQTVQHIADRASGGGSAVSADGLAPSIRRGSPAAGGAEPLAATAAFLFGLSPDS